MIVPHRCLRCSGVLSLNHRSMECRACDARWPVVNGVAAYSSADYFGEVTREEMQRLNEAAESGNWLRAAQAQFQANSEMDSYIADLNRASWVPLLPLGPDSTVLDVGSGLGVLTHALALTYDRVVSIEPIEERVRFTKTRMDQEGFKNVEVIQTALDVLPFFDGTFDLIVLNGVLEWMGVWQVNGTPREVQLEMLIRLRRLLKPGGKVLIGIENRIGFDSFLGRLDHPGTRFTSLMPRWLASLYMRLRRPGFYRMLLDSAQGYRTYTYSPRGYMKLLRQAGFESADLWWPPHGYNLPHDMFRLKDRKEVKAYLTRDRNYKNCSVGWAFRRDIRHWALEKTGLIYSMLPDVIIMADAPGVTRETAGSVIEAVMKVLGPSTVHAASLMSYGFRNKTVIKLVGADGTSRALAKLANLGRPDADVIEHGYRLLERLHPMMEHSGPSLEGTIPRPLQLLRVGSWVSSVESVAPGRSLEDLSMEPKYFADRQNVCCHLDRISTWLIAAQYALRKLPVDSVPRVIPPSWRQEGAPGSDTLSWTQHGDFFAGNVFWDPGTARLCVIDWDQCGGGYPPLYDWFCLVTGLYYTHRRVPQLPAGRTVDETSFRQTWFEPSWFADAVAGHTRRICEWTGLDHRKTADYFGQYLLIRHRQFRHEQAVSQKGVWAERYRKFHEFFLNNRERCIFHAR